MVGGKIYFTLLTNKQKVCTRLWLLFINVLKEKKLEIIWFQNLFYITNTRAHYYKT
jgi:hypothetical protein